MYDQRIFSNQRGPEQCGPVNKVRPGMSKQYSTGDKVRWKWGDGWGEGRVTERFTSSVTRTIDGTEVKRDASEDEPAYLIEQDDGDKVLKSHSELQKAG